MGSVRHPFNGHDLDEAWAQFVSRPFQDSTAFTSAVAGHRKTVPSLRSVNLEAARTTATRKHKHRLQAAVELLGEDNPDAASLKKMFAPQLENDWTRV